MRHKWNKVRKKNEIIRDFRKDENHVVYQIYECEHCGLRKGYSKSRYWSTLIYFKDEKYLSKDKLPYKCFHDKDFLFTEGDFEIV